MKKFELRMAGQVLVLLPGERSKGDKLKQVECLIVGGEHRAYLSVPLGGEGLQCTVVLPESACVFVDSESNQYAMIDVTGCKLTIGLDLNGGVELGDLYRTIDVGRFIGPVSIEDIEKHQVAATTSLTHGLLSHRGNAGPVHGLKDEKGHYGFDQDVTGELSLELGEHDRLVLEITNGVTTYTMELRESEYGLLSKGGMPLVSAANAESEAKTDAKTETDTKTETATGPQLEANSTSERVVLFLTALCGWHGTTTKRIDFADVEAVLPDRTYPRDLEYYTRPVHPKTGTCPPKIVSIQ
jgi:hypothetical protein